MPVRYIRVLLAILLLAELALFFAGPKGVPLALTHAGSRGVAKVDWWEDASQGIHLASAINAGLLAALLLSSGIWGKRLSRNSAENEAAAQSTVRPRWFWPATLVAILLCVALRVPLASKSLWWDEAWGIEQVSLGRWKEDAKKADGYRFQAHDWARCAWYYQKPTNHAPMSLLQKASIQLWQKVTHARREQFNDLAARLPALLASAIAVFLLAGLFRSWGRPGVGVAAALLLAVHPWHVRYGVDARAYALVVPLVIGGVWAISKILEQRGRPVGPWIAWGFVEWIWLWAYPNALLDIALLNAVLAVILWRQWRGQGSAQRFVIGRWIVTNLAAAMCMVQVFLPNLMQARHWVGQEADRHILDGRLALSTLSQLMCGVDPEVGHGNTLGMNLGWCCVALLVAHLAWLAWAGRARSLGHGYRWAILGSPLVSSLVFALVTLTLSSYFYPRFVIAALPVALGLVSLALATPCFGRQGTTSNPNRTIRARGYAIPMLLALLDLAILLPPAVSQNRWLATHPYAPLHDVASYIQKESANSPAPLIACYGLGKEVMPVYERRSQAITTRAELEELMNQAKAEHRPLWVICGYQGFNRVTYPEAFPLLDDPERFEKKQTFLGIEPDFTFEVLLAKGL